MGRLLLLLLSLGLTPGCLRDTSASNLGEVSLPGARVVSEPSFQGPPQRDLPTDWERVGPQAFAQVLGSWRAGQGGFSSEARGRLWQVLLPTSGRLEAELEVRAVLLAAVVEDPFATELLSSRLRARIATDVRTEDAADVVAARALLSHGQEPAVADLLVELSCGAAPHPDLEVRVECASSALAGGRDEPIAFLLRVLRARTPGGDPTTEDWLSTRTMAWAKTRAAHALSRRASLEVRFQPDASFEDMAQEIARLEAAL